MYSLISANNNNGDIVIELTKLNLTLQSNWSPKVIFAFANQTFSKVDLVKKA